MSMRPRRRTASTSTVEPTGTHAFKVDRYSLHKGLGVGKFVRSATFVVGGYDWSIRFYPDGCISSKDHASYVAGYLELISTDVAEVTASFDLLLVDQATGQSRVLLHQGLKVFNSDVTKYPSAFSGWGSAKLMKRSELEAWTFLRDDCLVIECDVTVLTARPRVKQTAAAGLQVVVAQMPPPSDLFDNLRRLLEEKQGADVTFKVRDEVFAAHKIILAMWSPVFNAEFFGPVAVAAAAESTTSHHCVTIEVKGMHPDVFGALLHFVYTDTMAPAMMDELDAGERKEMTRHLLVAADRYDMERLKLMCEASLCASIGVEDVAELAAFADRYRCEALGHACAEFFASSNEIAGNVVESPGYVHLKKSMPCCVGRHVRESCEVRNAELHDSKQHEIDDHRLLSLFIKFPENMPFFFERRQSLCFSESTSLIRYWGNQFNTES